MKRMSRAIGTWISLALVLAACAGAGAGGTGGGGSGGIGHPSGADRLVLRVEIVGGFVPPQVTLGRSPPFSLFGDGTVITEGPVPEIYPGSALPNLLSRRLTERGIQEVLRAAAAAGLTGPDRHFDDSTISDMPTTVFTLVAGGRRHVVSAYGLGAKAGSTMRRDERAARRKLATLERRLFDLSWLPVDTRSPERPYDPSALDVYVRPYRAVADPSVDEPQVTWPLADSLRSFGRPSTDDRGARCGTVRGAEATSVVEAARGANQLTPWMSGGDAYGLLFHSLLPDQPGC
jgi:hypothetical protein